jgi:hypothetical protein
MTYRDRLSPWCVVQKSAGLQSAIVARCRKRSSAEEHLRVLKRMNPAVNYEVVFDPVADEFDSFDRYVAIG